MNSDMRYEGLQRVSGPVSRETFLRLEALESLFLAWSERINLISASTRNDVWTRHILDSAQLWPLGDGASSWIDIGSGGGFPGLILAVMLKERVGGTIDLIDSNHKKTAFLRAATGELSLPARVHSRRISDVADLPTPQVVTARALAPLPDLLALASPWLSKGARGLFHKGRDYRTEVEESSAAWRFDLIEHPSKIDPEGVILEIQDLKRRS